MSNEEILKYALIIAANEAHNNDIIEMGMDQFDECPSREEWVTEWIIDHIRKSKQLLVFKRQSGGNVVFKGL